MPSMTRRLRTSATGKNSWRGPTSCWASEPIAADAGFCADLAHNGRPRLIRSLEKVRAAVSVPT